jgi:endo-1,4-beta-D-glucanase Y
MLATISSMYTSSMFFNNYEKQDLKKQRNTNNFVLKTGYYCNELPDTVVSVVM